MDRLIEQPQTAAFFGYLEDWFATLKVRKPEEIFQTPERCAILSVDLTEGFCHFGALASPRVAGLIDPVVHLMEDAWEQGVRNFVLSQDTHDPEAVEFSAWPPHCIRGTEEAETVEAIKALPFFKEMTLIEKNSIDSGMNGGLAAWIEAHPQVDTFVVVGDCTDLCVYQLAMFLRLQANEKQQQRRVIVPENCVQTYDLPVESALVIGAVPHPGDLLHVLFLYHLALNGVEVVKSI
jgi:nicotinamidase-related amidase